MRDLEHLHLGALSGSDLDEWFESRDSQPSMASDLAMPQLIRQGLRLHSETERLALLNEVFSLEHTHDSELSFYRLIVFWRTSRWIFLQRQFVGHGQRMDDARQNTPMLFQARGHRYIKPIFGYDTLRSLMGKPLPAHPRYCENEEELKQLQALHLMIALALEVPKGSEKLPSYGQLGLRNMDLGANVFAALFPTEQEIVQFEEELVAGTADRIVRRTKKYAEDRLLKDLNLRNDMASDVMQMASDKIVAHSRYSHDQRKAIMVMRLEGLIDRAQRALDVNAELRALKMLSSIEGLNSTVESDQRRNFIQLVQNEDDGSVQ